MRREFCQKDDISITYTDTDVGFEEMQTADSVMFSNTGKVLQTNFDKAKTRHYLNYFKKIYPTIMYIRTLDSMDNI